MCMPADSGTQQQQHEYGYDTCRLRSRQIDAPDDACLLCLVLLQSWYY